MMVAESRPGRLWQDGMEIDTGTLSEWGVRVMWLRSHLGMSYREIGKESHLPFESLYKMVSQPTYEPKYSVGVEFHAYFRRKWSEAHP